MPTPTFKLPLINGASPISIVNDMNALANAVDVALASLKGGTASAADIALIKQTAETALSTATKAANDVTKAQDAADSAKQTANSANGLATRANENASNATTTANEAKKAADALTAKVDALNAIMRQAASSDLYNFGATGYVRAAAPGLTYTNWHWQWCNGVLTFGGRETVTGTLPGDCITLPAGMAKPHLQSGATGVVTLGYGSIGNDTGRNLCEIHYDTKTKILSLYTPYLRTSSTPVFIEATVICGMDLSKL